MKRTIVNVYLVRDQADDCAAAFSSRRARVYERQARAENLSAILYVVVCDEPEDHVSTAERRR